MTTITSSQTPSRGFAGSRFDTIECTFARPADTAAYAVNDVISDSTSVAKAIEFAGAGQSGCIVSARVVMTETDTVDFDLFLFDAEPTNHLDNAALSLVLADAPKLVGILRFGNGGKLPLNAAGFECYRPYGNLDGAVISTNQTVGYAMQPLPFVSATGKLYGLLCLRTGAGWTPVASVTFNIRLGIDRGER